MISEESYRIFHVHVLIGDFFLFSVNINLKFKASVLINYRGTLVTLGLMELCGLDS